MVRERERREGEREVRGNERVLRRAVERVTPRSIDVDGEQPLGAPVGGRGRFEKSELSRLVRGCKGIGFGSLVAHQSTSLDSTAESDVAYLVSDLSPFRSALCHSGLMPPQSDHNETSILQVEAIYTPCSLLDMSHSLVHCTKSVDEVSIPRSWSSAF